MCVSRATAELNLSSTKSRTPEENVILMVKKKHTSPSCYETGGLFLLTYVVELEEGRVQEARQMIDCAIVFALQARDDGGRPAPIKALRTSNTSKRAGTSLWYGQRRSRPVSWSTPFAQ